MQSTNTDLTAIVLLVAAVFLLGLLGKNLGGRGGWKSRRSDKSGWTKTPAPLDLRDPAQQMHAISQIDFEVTPLLNKEEARILPILEATARKIAQGHRIMAQTSLGEVLRPKENSGTASDRPAAYASINSKRLDFAVIDRFGRLVLAVEYQGSGHYHSRSFMRDAVKREVLRKAGVHMLEVPSDFVAQTLTEQVEEHLTRSQTPQRIGHMRGPKKATGTSTAPAAKDNEGDPSP